jgi:hypothetical protein
VGNSGQALDVNRLYHRDMSQQNATVRVQDRQQLRDVFSSPTLPNFDALGFF